MSSELKLHHALTLVQVDQLVDLYQAEWWTKGREKADVEAMLSASDMVFAYVDSGGDLAAFARVLTNRIYKAFIFDVIVRPDLRGMGLGDRVMEDIKNYPALSKVRHVELYCRPELQSFYTRHGFTADTGGIVLMRMGSRG